ncbi:hypothetical protein ARUE_113p00990 (plasmid) [Arthrobacter sp. Rue61a]|nr:hypothetical protein ARUE_113p00990 [Arthrobacter sp. Rue61a]
MDSQGIINATPTQAAFLIQNPASDRTDSWQSPEHPQEAIEGSSLFAPLASTTTHSRPTRTNSAFRWVPTCCSGSPKPRACRFRISFSMIWTRPGQGVRSVVRGISWLPVKRGRPSEPGSWRTFKKYVVLIVNLWRECDPNLAIHLRRTFGERTLLT